MAGTAFIVIIIIITAVIETVPNFTSLKSLENAESYFREPEISFFFTYFPAD